MNEKVTKGYKVFNPDWTCRGFQYKVGETYHHDGEISLCNAGFHFCERVADCFSYYSFDPDNKVAVVKAIGKVHTDGEKSVTDCITIVRELSWVEMLDIANTGKGNTGINNTGDLNTGNRNTGNRNTGNRNTGNRNTGNGNTGNGNTGDFNTGNWNTGYGNTGDFNTGNMNTGNWNTGYGNTGNMNTGNGNTGYGNTGDFNTGDFNTGFFNTNEPFARCFNSQTTIKISKYMLLDGVKVLQNKFKNVVFVKSSEMTEAEKSKHPEHETIGGYLKEIPYKKAFRNMWEGLSDKEKDAVKALPNFDADIFFKITGIRVRK